MCTNHSSPIAWKPCSARLIAALLAVVTAVCVVTSIPVLPAQAAGHPLQCVSDWAAATVERMENEDSSFDRDLFTFDRSTGTITGVDRDIQKAVIPKTIDGVPVRAIGKKTFYACDQLQSISLPETLETIGESAFYCCTALEQVEIPASVYEIGSYAFYGCSSLQSIRFAGDRWLDLGRQVFGECYQLEEAESVPDDRWRENIESLQRARAYMDTQSLDAHRVMWRLYGDREKEVAFRKTAKEITKGLVRDRDKVEAIGRWLAERIRYNTEHFDEENPADNTTEVWAVYQGIRELEGTGIPYATTCGGYSNMMQVLCQALGIPAATVWKERRPGESMDHEFNMIYFEGQWRWVDITASDDDDAYAPEEIEWLDTGLAGFAFSSSHRADHLLYRETEDETIYVPIPETPGGGGVCSPTNQ